MPLRRQRPLRTQGPGGPRPRRPGRRAALLLAAVGLLACGGAAERVRTPAEVEADAVDQQARLLEAYTRAELARFLDDLDTAVAQARTAYELAPAETRVVLTLGQLLRLSAKYDEAAQVLQDGIARVDDPLPLQLELATVEDLRGNPVAAAAAYVAATRTAPDDLTPFGAYADYLASQGEPRAAVDTLDGFIARHPDNADAWRHKGHLLEQSGQPGPAFAAYQEAARLDPNVEGDFVPRIRLARAIGDDAQGEQIAEDCFRAFRQNVDCRIERIHTLDGMSLDPDTRQARVFEVLQTLGRNIGANLGRLRQVEGQIADGLGPERAFLFDRGVADDRPRNTQIQARAAWAAYRMGDEDTACEYMQRVLDVNPRDAEALNFIGYSYAERGVRLDEAEGLIRQALAIRPNDGNIQDSLGWVFFKGGRYTDAIEWLERAVNNIPDSAVLRDHLADAYRAAGRMEEALKQYLCARDLADDTLRPAIQAKIDALQHDLPS